MRTGKPKNQKTPRPSGIRVHCSECKISLERNDWERGDGLCWKCRNVLEMYGGK